MPPFVGAHTKVIWYTKRVSTTEKERKKRPSEKEIEIRRERERESGGEGEGDEFRLAQRERGTVGV